MRRGRLLVELIQHALVGAILLAATFIGLDLLFEIYYAFPGDSVAATVVVLDALVLFLGKPLLLGVVVLLSVVLLPSALWTGGEARRRTLLLVGIAAVVVLLGVVLQYQGPAQVRRIALAGVADRMEPVVSAVLQYEDAHGSPPARLADLPLDTDLLSADAPRACRDMRFQRLQPPKAGSGWELRMDCGYRGWAILDQFYYRPSGIYPEGRWHMPVRGWVYFWD